MSKRKEKAPVFPETVYGILDCTGDISFYTDPEYLDDAAKVGIYELVEVRTVRRSVTFE